MILVKQKPIGQDLKRELVAITSEVLEETQSSPSRSTLPKQTRSALSLPRSPRTPSSQEDIERR